MGRIAGRSGHQSEKKLDAAEENAARTAGVGGRAETADAFAIGHRDELTRAEGNGRKSVKICAIDGEGEKKVAGEGQPIVGSGCAEPGKSRMGEGPDAHEMEPERSRREETESIRKVCAVAYPEAGQ